MTTYNYVIAGAGSAGGGVGGGVCGGGPARPAAADEIHLPAGLLAVGLSKYDWAFISDPEPGLGYRQRYLPRGRTLGGSASRNAMIYIRGNRADYDEWGAVGLSGW